MITKEIAMNITHGTTLYHVELTGGDNRPIRCRVNGKCKTWKTRPNEFRIPVKHAMLGCFYITEWNANEWRKEEIDGTLNVVVVNKRHFSTD